MSQICTITCLLLINEETQCGFQQVIKSLWQQEAWFRRKGQTFRMSSGFTAQDGEGTVTRPQLLLDIHSHRWVWTCRPTTMCRHAQVAVEINGPNADSFFCQGCCWTPKLFSAVVLASRHILFLIKCSWKSVCFFLCVGGGGQISRQHWDAWLWVHACSFARLAQLLSPALFLCPFHPRGSYLSGGSGFFPYPICSTVIWAKWLQRTMTLPVWFFAVSHGQRSWCKLGLRFLWQSQPS